MPQTEVLFFADDDGSAPLLGWLDAQQPKVQDKCLVRIERLAECGHELRRPEADFLRNGVHELRVRHMNVNYRILYFFHEGRAVVTHGLTKEGQVPDREINVAIERSIRFKRQPEKHTYHQERE
jgi:phage-related protein